MDTQLSREQGTTLRPGSLPFQGPRPRRTRHPVVVEVGLRVLRDGDGPVNRTQAPNRPRGRPPPHRLPAPAHTAPSAGSVLRAPSSCPFSSPTPVPPSPPWLKHPLPSSQAPAGSLATPTSRGCLQHAQGSEVGEKASDHSLTPVPSCSSLRARLAAALVSLSPSLPPPPGAQPRAWPQLALSTE